LFDIKVYRESRSDDDREIARILLSAIISSGVNENEYTDVVDCVKELIDQDLSFSTIEWVMDVCEVLSTGNTANQNKKNEFLSYVLSIVPVKGQAHRFNKAQLLLIKQLCLDIRQEELFSLYEEVNQSLEEEITLDLAGKLIAIYTLTESAGLRAKKIIETLFQGSKVTLNSDHVETDRLKQLAKNSDFFVFASKSSTHQAYYAAKKYHPRDLLMPTGKGSASIVSKIMELQN
jgi:inorganic pyrophosphatase/exopolyphosphatase